MRITIKINSPKTARHKKIPYRLYGNMVSALIQEPKEADGNSGEVPLPGVPPEEVHT